MTVRIGALICMALVASARAETPDPDGPIPPNLRRAYEEGDYETVRRELIKAYALAPQPQILFALGQVEYNLGNYEAAIRYYEKFLETRPGEREIGLAQQAIGAARMKLSQPKPEPTPEPPPQPQVPEQPRVPPRQWYAEDSGLVALGGAAILVGGGLLYYSHSLGDDHGGSLADYDNRVKQSRTTMWTGVGVASAGAIVIGITLLRWGLRPNGPGNSAVSASIAPGSATFLLTGRW